MDDSHSSSSHPRDPGPPVCSIRLLGPRASPVVLVRGEIDLSTATQFAATVELALETAGRVELDLQETTFMDSTGLAVIVAAHRRAGQLPEAVVVRDPSPEVRRVLELSGLDRLVTIRMSGRVSSGSRRRATAR